MPKPASLPLIFAALPFVLVVRASAQEQYSFEPFGSIDGTLSVDVLYDTPPGSPCADAGDPVGDGEIVRDLPFGYYVVGSVEADAVEKCSVHYGSASVEAWQFRDLIESRPPDYITSGHEWSFTFYADAHPLGGAEARAEIEFTLNRPCLVSFRAEHDGWFFASLGDMRNENYYPTNGTIIDYYHYDTEILGPGTHTLSASAIPSSDRGFIQETNATLWIRFDDAYCSPADLADPFGMHDSSDIQAFIAMFLAHDPVADMNADGVTDLADIERFVDYFLGGCVSPEQEP